VLEATDYSAGSGNIGTLTRLICSVYASASIRLPCSSIGLSQGEGGSHTASHHPSLPLILSCETYIERNAGVCRSSFLS